MEVRSLFRCVYASLQEGLSVRRSVRRSVGPSVGRSVTRFFLTAEFKPISDLTSINAPAQRTRLILSCIPTCFLLFFLFPLTHSFLFPLYLFLHRDLQSDTILGPTPGGSTEPLPICPCKRFPCPAQPFLVFLGGSRAAAPIGNEVL